MATLILKMLFIVGVSAQFGKHIYVPEKLTWIEAQQYCRKHYTDLSPIRSAEEEEILKYSPRHLPGQLWIGLYRNESEWKWSEGGNPTYLPWDHDEPDNDDQHCGVVCWHGCNWNGWYNRDCMRRKPFLCIDLIVKQDLATWEQAMLLCKETDSKLTSLDSENKIRRATRLIQHSDITERVWIGLRFLADQWLWVDGKPLVYEAWAKGEEKDWQCPVWRRCGALTRAGAWENLDCQERLHFICY